MKKLLLLSIVILTACSSSVPGGIYLDMDNLPPVDPAVEWAEMKPGVEYAKFDNAILFDDNGCLIEDLDGHYPCLGTDGCITREEYEAFMEIWKFRAPEPDVPLCDQL